MITHSTVRQILEVLRIFQNGHIKGLPVNPSYQNAVRNVAKQSGVTYQTIGDGCRRRLKLKNIGELYDLLNRWTLGDPDGIVEQLKKVSPTNIHAEIMNFFYNYQFKKTDTATGDVPVKQQEIKTEEFSFKLSEKDARILKAIAEIEGTSISEMIAVFVSKSLRAKMKEIAQDM